MEEVIKLNKRVLTQSDIDEIVLEHTEKIDKGYRHNTNIILSDVILKDIIFKKAYIANIMFERVLFDNVKFLNTNMKGAVFCKCELNDVLFESSKVGNTMFDKTKLNKVNILKSDFTGSSFKNVELNEFVVQQSCFDKAYFREVNKLGILPGDLVMNEELYLYGCYLPRSFCRISYQNTDIVYDSYNDVVIMYRPPKSISKSNRIYMSFSELCEYDFFKNGSREYILKYLFTYGDEFILGHVCDHDPEKVAELMIKEFGYEKIESNDENICLRAEDEEYYDYVAIPNKGRIKSRSEITIKSIPKNEVFENRRD